MKADTAPSYSAEEIVSLCFSSEASIIGDRGLRVEGVADLASASPRQLSFFANSRYLSDFTHSAAGIVVVSNASQALPGRTYIIHSNPTYAFQKVLDLFCGQSGPRYTGFSMIHPTAVVHETAEIAEAVSIGPYAVIDEGAVIEKGAVILPHAYIGRQVHVGQDALIHAHAVIREECVIGARAIIQPGAVIGSCGFGYATDQKGHHTKLHHWGSVTIEDDVEVGANTTIDRGRFQPTVVGRGTKIDNLVQVAHNVIIGRWCFLVSQVGIAGSTKIGNHVVLAGKVAVNGHIEITDGVVVAACSAVSKSLRKPGKYSGIPVQKIEEYNKNAVYLRKIEQLFERVQALESGRAL